MTSASSRVGHQSRRAILLAASLLAALATLVAAALILDGSGTDRASASAGATEKRTLLVVGNNWDGTVDFINPRTLEKVDRINVARDFEGCESLTPPQNFACEANNEAAAEGHNQLVDDVRASPDGRTLYVSRPSMGDVAAIDLASRDLLWTTEVSGFRSDHIALSPDGEELLVSATTERVVDVIDTDDGAIVDQIETGDFPHENEYSHDGELIYNGSIGRVISPDLWALDPGKGDRWFTIADADTHEVKDVIDFHRGVRPFHVLPNERIMYVQLSFMHGFVEYDLKAHERLRTVRLPLSEEAEQLEREDYPLDSAHHGIALNRDYSRICVAGTVSNYGAILSRRTLRTKRIIDTGRKPYWATASNNGEYCFISNSDTDDISVLTFEHPREVKRIEVGDHPQRARILGVRL